MPDQKKTRNELKSVFAENSIPTAEDFAALIEAGLNQADDLVVLTAGVVAVDAITAKTANTALSLSGNGTGIVQVDDPLTVTGALNANSGLTVTNTLSADTITSKTTDTALTLSGNGAGIVQVNDPLTVTGALNANSGLTVTGTVNADTITSKTTDTALTLSGNGAGIVQVNDPLTVTGQLSVDTITSTTANTALALSGNGTGIVQVNDPLTVTGLLTASNGLMVSVGTTSVQALSATGLAITNSGLATTRGLDLAFGTRSNAANAANHPQGRPLYVSGVTNSAGVEFRTSDGTLGISIESDSIQPVGISATQGLNLYAKGTGTITLGSGTSQPTTVSGALTVNSGLAVTGALTASGLVTANGGLTVAAAQSTSVGAVTASGLVTANGGLTVTGSVTLSNSGLATTRGFDVAFGPRTNATNAAYHPTGRPLYVSGVTDEFGVEFRTSDGSQGISIERDSIQPVGPSATLSLNLYAKGTGTVTLGSGTSQPTTVRGVLNANYGLAVIGEVIANDLVRAYGGLTVTGALNANGGLTVAAAQSTSVGALTASGRVTANGGLTIPTGQTLTITSDWKPITLSAGWSVYFTRAAESYKDPFGIVHLRGFLIKPTAFNSTIGTLPSDHRPPTNLRAFAAFANGSTNAFMLYVIDGSGVLMCQADIPAATHLALDGVSFSM